MTTIRTYSEMMKLKTFKERFEYLKLDGRVGEETFGFDRYLNQEFYHKDPKWKSARNKAIVRDNGCDLAVKGRKIEGPINVHHINPITKSDILNRDPKLYDLENLVCTDYNRTHKAIHYGSEQLLPQDPIVRTKNDTCPWKQ